MSTQEADSVAASATRVIATDGELSHHESGQAVGLVAQYLMISWSLSITYCFAHAAFSSSSHHYL